MASLLFSVKLPQGLCIREVLGRGARPGLVPTPLPGRGPLGLAESSPAPPGPRGAGPRGRAAGGRGAEKKGMGGGAGSWRQREQQIAPSQWQRRDEVAPNSLRPMARQRLPEPISISPGAGLRLRSQPGPVCLQHPGCAWPAPSTPRLCLLPSPPMRGSRREPTPRTLPLLAANKRSLRKYGARPSPASSSSL